MAPRALRSSGWLVAAAVVALYVMAEYDVTIRERGPGAGTAAAASGSYGAPDEPEAAGSPRYRSLAAQAQKASGAARHRPETGGCGVGVPLGLSVHVRASAASGLRSNRTSRGVLSPAEGSGEGDPDGESRRDAREAGTRRRPGGTLAETGCRTQ